MRFFFLLLLIYIASIIQPPLDIPFILVSFSALYYKKVPSMILALFSGFLADLYISSYLGAGMFSYLLSIYLLIWVRRHTQLSGYLILPIVFSGFAIKSLLFSVLTKTSFPLLSFFLTTLLFLPSFLILSQILYKRWHPA